MWPFYSSLEGAYSYFRFSAEEKAKRHPYVHLPFGGGPRGCIGKMLALLEIKMVLVETMRKFSFVQSPETEVSITNYVYMSTIIIIIVHYQFQLCPHHGQLVGCTYNRTSLSWTPLDQ